MTSEQFTYWLQGYAELNDAPPTAEQWQSIREHLSLVFRKVTTNHLAPGDRFPRPPETPFVSRPASVTC